MTKQYSSQEIASIISSQFENQVAFFNLKDKNAFFFISPEEARIAMDYIRQWRIDGFKQMAREKQLDEYVEAFKNDYSVEKTKVVSIKKELKDKFDPSGSGVFSISFLNYSLSFVENGDRTVDAIIMSAITYADVRNWGRVVYDEATKQEVLNRGVVGRVFGADIYVFNKIDNGNVILVSMPDKKNQDFLAIQFDS